MKNKKRVLFIGEASYLATGFSTYWNEVIKRLHATNKWEIAEQGSYGQDGDPRNNQVPWKFYSVKPHPQDKEATRIYDEDLTRGSRKFQFGEFRFNDVCLDWKPDIVCVPPGTNIETEYGIKPIENIKMGDKVLTHRGRMRPVIKTMRRQHMGKMIKIYPHNDNISYSFTEEHPILVIQSKKRTWKERDVRQRHKIKDAKFIPAKDLSKGDYVLIPIYNPQNTHSNILDITNHLNQFIFDKEDQKIYPAGHKNYKNDNGLPRYIEITEDFARLLGYYCAEGSCSRGQIQFSFGTTDQENQYVKDVQQLIQKTLHLSASVRKSQNSNEQSVICCSSLLSDLMGILMGIGAHNKKMPNYIWQTNNINLISSFLQGLIKGDGCYKPDTVSLSTVSKILARQVRMVLARIGLKASIVEKLNKPNQLVRCERVSFDIECYGQSARLAHGFINKHHKLLSRNSDNPKWINKGGIGWIDNNYIIIPIRRIRTKEYHGQVYNLEVEEDNSYVAGFSVHNCGIRDFWMDEFVLRSPFRNKFKFIWMPTIDGIPQKQMWLDDYKLCDGILTYSEWGMNVLKKDGRTGTNLLTIASPGADLEVFKPVENKREHKGKLGIDPNSLIVGTIMRNQKRKLYYDLIEAFAQWLYKSKSKGHLELANRTFLYLHTSYPDQGWDIGAAVKEFNVGNKVIMTYLCKECKTAFPAMFSGDITHCRKCNKFCAIPPNAGMHCPRNVLADIINTFDLYVQYSISEGFGMPCVEAMACGVPIAAVRYSAMEDHLKCPTSIPIEVGRFFREAVIETEQRRALPDNQDFVRKLDVFLKKSEEQRRNLSQKTRQYCMEPVEVYGQKEKLPRYSWERTAKIWEHIIDRCSIYDHRITWDNPEPYIHKPHLTPEKLNLNNAEFIRWLIKDIWNHPERCGTYFEGEWIRILNGGFRREGPNVVPMDRKKILEHFLSLVECDNQQELRRIGRMKTEDQNKVHAMLM